MKFKVDTTEYARWREQRRERADKLLQRALEEAGPEQARWAARYTPPSGKSIEKYNAARENDGKYWVRSREFGREKREWEPGRRHNGRNVAQKYFQGNEIEPVLYRRKYYYLPKLAGATSNGGFRKRIKAELDRGMRYAVVVNRYGRPAGVEILPDLGGGGTGDGDPHARAVQGSVGDGAGHVRSERRAGAAEGTGEHQEAAQGVARVDSEVPAERDRDAASGNRSFRFFAGERRLGLPVPGGQLQADGGESGDAEGAADCGAETEGIRQVRRVVKKKELLHEHHSENRNRPC